MTLEPCELNRRLGALSWAVTELERAADDLDDGSISGARRANGLLVLAEELQGWFYELLEELNGCATHEPF